MMNRFPLLLTGLLLAGCGAAPIDFGAVVATPEGRCEAEKLILDASMGDFVAAGLPEAIAERWLEKRRGPDGVEGTDDDAFLTLADAREALGDGGVEQLYAFHLRAGSLPPCDRVDVQLLALNDFHGALEPPTGGIGVIHTEAGPVDAGGLVWLVPTLRALRASNPERTVVVGAGDMIGATPLISAAFQDEPTIEGLDLAGLAISAVGNHEFDEGHAELLRIQRGGCHPDKGCFRDTPWEGARFQYLAASTIDEATGAPILPPYAVRRFGRVKVGFIGMTLEGTPDIVRPDGIKGIRFLNEVETANRYAAELKAKGVHTIVVLLHEGGLPEGSYRGCDAISGKVVDIAAWMTADVSVIVSGHTHRAYVCEIAGKLVTSAAANGRLVTDIDLTIDEQTGTLIGRVADNIIVRREGEPDPEAEALVAYWAGRVEAVASRVLGRVELDLPRKAGANGQSPLGQLIADAQLEASRPEAAGGAQLALMNPGGVRADLMKAASEHGEAEGEVTYGEVFAVQPFQNELVTLTLTGAQLKELFEQQFARGGKERDRYKILHVSSNVGYTFRKGAPPGDKVDPRTLTIDGRRVSPRARYRVVANAFLANGGDDFPAFALGEDRHVGIDDVDALAEFIAKKGPIRKLPPSRVKALP